MTLISTVRMGEIQVVQSEGSLSTLLGSCVGLAIHDRHRQLAGLAHILLPRSDGSIVNPGRYVDTAVEELLRQLELVRGPSGRLLAHIAGGATMFGDSPLPTVGELNVQSLESDLQRRGIPVLTRDCGGNRGRRMTVDVATGRVTIVTLASSTVGGLR